MVSFATSLPSPTVAPAVELLANRLAGEGVGMLAAVCQSQEKHTFIGDSTYERVEVLCATATVSQQRDLQSKIANGRRRGISGRRAGERGVLLVAGCCWAFAIA